MYEKRLNEDWDFSNYVHNEALKNNIYQNFFKVEKATTEQDLQQGIDYWAFFKNSKGEAQKHSIQERFRKYNKYLKHLDEFTFRYKRENSLSVAQQESEFFKIEADYLLYGIYDTDNNKFAKYGFFDINKIKNCIKNKNIKIDLNLNNEKKQAYYDENTQTAYAILKHNYENTQSNSSFLIFSVDSCFKADPKIVKIYKDFVNPNKPTQLKLKNK